jgi:hypothetical protein
MVQPLSSSSLGMKVNERCGFAIEPHVFLVFKNQTVVYQGFNCKKIPSSGIKKKN